MSVNIELPTEMEQRLRAQNPNLDAEAKEAVLIDLYRHDKLSHFELSQALGLDRFETDEILKKHNVTEDVPSDQQYEAALSRLGVLTDK